MITPSSEEVERFLLVCSLAEGLPGHLLVRQAGLLVELAERHWVRVVEGPRAGTSSWGALLSDEQRLAYDLLFDDGQPAGAGEQGPEAEGLRRRMRLVRRAVMERQLEARQALAPAGWRGPIGDPYARHLLLRHPGAVPAFLAPESVLLLLSPPGGEVPAASRSCPAVLALNPEAAAGTDLQPPGGPDAPYPLPIPLHPAFRPLPQPPPGRRPVLIIGCGKRELDRLLPRWLGEAGAKECTLFDPSPGATPPGVAGQEETRPGFAGPLPPEERARFYRTCGAVILADDDPKGDNHFLQEAVACGLLPLSTLLPDDPALRWSPEAVRRCLEGWSVGGEWPEPGRPAPSSGVAEALTRYLLADRPGEPRPGGSRGPATFRSLAEATGDSRHRLAGRRGRLFVVSGSAARPSTAMNALAAAAEEVHLYAPGNRDLAAALRGACPREPLAVDRDVPGQLARLVSTLPPGADLRVLFLSLAAPIRQALELEIARLGRAEASPPALPRRTILLRQGRPAAPGGSGGTQYVGSQVINQLIAMGLAAAAGERIALRWLDLPQETIRPYFPSRPAGAGGEVVHLPQLPALLRQGRVDLLYSGDPDIHWSIGARALWARRPLPITGLIFATDNQQVSDPLLPLLISGPTYPYDRYVSPTRCGARAWRELLAEVEEWLSRRTAAPVSFQGEVAVLPFGIDASAFAGLDRRSCREAMQLPADSLILLSVGRLSLLGKADLLPLLLATTHLLRQGHDLHLVLCGGGDPDYAKRVEQMARELGLGPRVRVLTFAGEREKALLYGAADIFVSLVDNPQETYGVVVLEAMAAGLPLIVSDWDGYKELVEPGVTGLLVPTRWTGIPDERESLVSLAVPRLQNTRDLHESVVVDLPALCGHLESLIGSAERRERFGREGRRQVVERYDTVVQGRRLLELMDQQIEEARQTPGSPAAVQLTPFVDRLSRRFGHYPTAMITGRERLVPSPENRFGGWQEMILELMSFYDRDGEERDLARQMVAAVAERSWPTIDQLTEELQGRTTLEALEIRQRILRCVKYGLIELQPD